MHLMEAGAEVDPTGLVHLGDGPLARPVRMSNDSSIDFSSKESVATSNLPQENPSEDERDRIVGEEASLLDRVKRHLTTVTPSRPPPPMDHEEAMLSLRDQIAE